MKTLDLKIPTEWNQLSQKEILYVCRLFFLNLTGQKFKLLLFLKLTGVKALPNKIVADNIFYIFRKNNIRFSLSVDELHWFLKSTDFLTTDSKLTKNVFPRFRIFWKRFFGPSNKCYNITFLEFLNIESCIYAFHKTRENKHLDQLCAIMYRRQKKEYRPNSPDYNGDRREPFNDYTYTRRASWFKLLPLVKKYAVYVFYIGCRNALMKAHPNLFSSTPVNSEPVNPIENLKKIMYSLNQGDITKNKQIQHTQIWEAFGQLEEMVNQSKPKKG